MALRESRVVFTFAGLDVDTKYLLLCLAICCWGVAKGGGNVVDSSLADSVPTGTPQAWGPAALTASCAV